MTSQGTGSKLAVLGLLALGPNHGYGLRAILESWEVHRWLDIKYGSIYAALNRFAETGSVEVAAVDSEGGPTRTTYRLTVKGNAELRALTEQAWTDLPRWSTPIDLALILLSLNWMGRGVFSKDEVLQLLDQRIDRLNEAAKYLQQTAADMKAISDLPALRALQDAHFDHGALLLRAELEWSRSVRTALEQGKFGL